MDGDRTGRRWIGRWWPAPAGAPGVGPEPTTHSERLLLVPAAEDGELSRRLAVASSHERHRLTQAARAALMTLVSAEPQLEQVHLDHERGAALLSFAGGRLLRAAADRSVHPSLDRLAGRLRWDPVYLSAARLSADGGVLLRLVCGAFWPMEIGPLVPAAR